MYPGEEPVRRRGWQWWQFLLAGCGGCGVLLLLAVIAAGVFGFSMVKTVMEGQDDLTPEVVQQRLGKDVPLPEDGELRLDETKMASGAMGFVTKAAGLGPVAVGIYVSPRSSTQILATYDKELPRQGWKRSKATEDGGSEQHWVKGSESLSITVEPSGQGSQVTLMRGSLALLNADTSAAGAP